MIGEKIKYLRNKNGMTQKELADKLYVTSQAVSRWENGEVEPSINTVLEMSKIFNISVDDLVNDKPLEKEVDDLIEEIAPEEKIEQEEKKEEKVVETIIQEKIVYAEPPKQMLALCECCNKPIYESKDIHRFNTTTTHHSGRTRHHETKEHLYCTKCYEKKLEEDRKEAERQAAIKKAQMKNRRISSYVWGGISAAAVGVIGFFAVGVPGALLAIPMFTFISCLILGNNVVGDVWLAIASWSIKLPRLIFTLDLDGIIWFLTVKLIGAILSFFLSIAAFLFATVIGFIMSLFVYPFSLARHYKGQEDSVI